MAVQIIKPAIDAIVAALNQSAPNGFNALLASFWSTYGITGTAYVIDFSDTSQNFFRDNYGILDLYDDESITLPAVCVYEGGDEQTNEVVTSTFSGSMVATVEHHLVWPSGGTGVRTFYKLRNAVHDSMWNCFNSQVPQPAFLGTGIRYNGRIRMDPPGPIISPEDDDEETGDILQSVRFHVMFDLNT